MAINIGNYKQIYINPENKKNILWTNLQIFTTDHKAFLVTQYRYPIMILSRPERVLRFLLLYLGSIILLTLARMTNIFFDILL